jgi:hypothetical protein
MIWRCTHCQRDVRTKQGLRTHQALSLECFLALLRKAEEGAAEKALADQYADFDDEPAADLLENYDRFRMSDLLGLEEAPGAEAEGDDLNASWSSSPPSPTRSLKSLAPASGWAQPDDADSSGMVFDSNGDLGDANHEPVYSASPAVSGGITPGCALASGSAYYEEAF